MRTHTGTSHAYGPKLRGESPVNQTELLRFVVDQLEDMGLRYFITGSIASISYGEARFTNDIDIVVDLPARRAADLCRRFPDDQFYVSEDAALDAARGHGQFNIIHPASGLKIDIIVPPPSEFTVERFVRAVRMPAGDDSEAVFSSAEDIILSKMLFYREGKSDKQPARHRRHHPHPRRAPRPAVHRALGAPARPGGDLAGRVRASSTPLTGPRDTRWRTRVLCPSRR